MSSEPEAPRQPTMPGQPDGYGYGYGYAAPRPTNVLAIIALVLSLMGISIGAVISGHISLAQIRRTGEQGHGMALAGLIIGYVGCAFWVLAAIFAIVFPLIMWATIGGAASGGYSAS
jgi:hypothetical protein